ncbi:hypothetical protein HK099_007687, partial [Clydaea vesicula]
MTHEENYSNYKAIELENFFEMDEQNLEEATPLTNLILKKVTSSDIKREKNFLLATSKLKGFETYLDSKKFIKNNFFIRILRARFKVPPAISFSLTSLVGVMLLKKFFE